MNERFRLLAEQAESSRLEYNSATMMTERIQEFDKQKFAELIVRECVNWIDGSPTTEEGTLILSKSFIIANLKQHFGVEE